MFIHIRLILTVILTGLLFPLFLFCQDDSSIKVSGVILTEDQQPVDFASVSILASEDTAVVDFQLSDESGNYEFQNLKAGGYLLRISRLGFPDYTTEAFQLVDGQHLEMSPVMQSTGNDLAVVEVTSRRPMVAFSGGKMVVAADQLPGKEISSGLEILNKVPGVFVNGTSITLNGFGNVNVLINGRRRTMTASQAATLLQGIPAENIKTIEVRSGKSVSQDASGTGGEINIITHKSLGQFFNFSLRNRVTIDRFVSNSHNAYLNYNGSRIRFNGGINYTRNYSYGNQQRNERYFDNDENLFGTNQVNINSQSLSQLPSGNFGIEYDLSSKQRIGINGNSYFTVKDGRTTNLSTFDFVDAEDRDVLLGEQLDLNDNLSSFDAYYENDLDSLGSRLTANLGYLTGYSREQIDFDRREPPTLSGSEALNLRTRLPLDGAQTTFRTDLKKYLSPSTVISAGIKISDGSIENFSVFDTISRQPPVRNLELSDSLGYQEQVYAAYASISHEMGYLSFEAGLRAEATRTETYSYKVDARGGQSYENLFPNLAVSYAPSANHQFTLNYSSSITRPNYLELNPYVRYLDAFTFTTGNNELLPEIDHRLTLNTRLYRLLYLNFGLIRGQRYVGQVRELTEDGLTTSITPQNAFNVRAGYVQAIIYYQFGKNEKVQGQLSSLVVPLNYLPLPAFEDQAQFTGSTTKVVLSASTQVKLTDRLTIEGDYRFTRGRLYFQRRNLNQWVANAQLRYRLPGDAFTLAVGATDLFNSNNAAGERFFTGFESDYASDFNTRRVSIALNYRLGKLRKNYRRGPEGDVGRFQ
ncbi:TonB-dependent receptor [Neolewinella agarilytica]|uniref:Outer membrane receptor proteins, mostly Fe transport n=1 Tax=Neolewinella agarilytica TaxID=478744 RepID=A0A1H9KD16_9BACT|nr:TonB-dependent receptor [Neolewinella agarilytica]SEQ97040.1 Outer membrane receptor proteins, mostly Fe transport [Neolewinella agarilytica]